MCFALPAMHYSIMLVKAVDVPSSSSNGGVSGVLALVTWHRPDLGTPASVRLA